MVLLGTLMLLFMLLGLFYRWRGRIERRRTWLRLAVLAIPIPHLAIQLGWMTAEVGRQPWIVYGLMRTEAGVSSAVNVTDIVLSIALFGVVYAALFVLWLWMLVDEIRHGPDVAPARPPTPSGAPLGTPGRPGPVALGGH